MARSTSEDLFILLVEKPEGVHALVDNEMLRRKAEMVANIVYEATGFPVAMQNTETLEITSLFPKN